MAVSKVFVIGLGMGNPDLLTKRALDALAQSGLIVGSQRLIDALDFCDAPKHAAIEAHEIADVLRASDAPVVSVVMSGDVGFYSGATRLYEALEGMDVEAIPGVSSLSYLCARLQTSWQDVTVVSAHGRAHNMAGVVQSHARTFVLAGGAATPEALCAELVRCGLGDVRVHVGERLSYADERISSGTAAELADGHFDGLSVLLVENDHSLSPVCAAPQLADEAFVRADVPMTKEEVRELVVCKLRVRPDDVVWDVGAGTGSVSVELARAAYEGRVIAIERSSEAVALITQNKERFSLSNLEVMAGEAPEALRGLPMPDRVFVGGSSGNLADILAAAVAANPAARICATAITLETVADLLACVRELGLRHEHVVQLSIARGQMVSGRHLMRANNPVYLLTADGPAGDENGAGKDGPCE